MIVNEVAKELKIPTVELQHGIIGMQHVAYNYLSKGNYCPLPDYLFYYSNYWKGTCRFPIDQDKQISVGFPFFEAQAKKNPSISKEGNILRLLVLSQPVYKYEIINFIDSLLCILEESVIDYYMIFKLHPAEFNQPVEDWNRITNHKNVDLLNNSQESLYHVFSRVDTQIGVTSTAIFEGLSYGLNTFIMDIGNAHERMKDLITRGLVEFCKRPIDIKNSDKLFSRNNVLSNKTEFFEPESMKNLVDNINKIMCRRGKNA